MFLFDNLFRLFVIGIACPSRDILRRCLRGDELVPSKYVQGIVDEDGGDHVSSYFYVFGGGTDSAARPGEIIAANIVILFLLPHLYHFQKEVASRR